MLTCPLCHDTVSTQPFHTDSHRDFMKCSECELIFVHPKFLLNKEEEKSRYDLHMNCSDDPSYRRFLSQILPPVFRFITHDSCGLDFGSGPEPSLQKLFQEHGYHIRIYDPFYAPDASVLKKKYDFIMATEVVEHLYTPLKTLNMVWNCLKPNGILAIMTQTHPPDFSNWWYKNDKTHVSFFSQKSFSFLNGYWKAKIVFQESNIILFKKLF